MFSKNLLLTSLDMARSLAPLKSMLNAEYAGSDEGTEALKLIDELIESKAANDSRKSEKSWIALISLPIIHENKNFLDLTLIPNIKIIPNHLLYKPMIKLIDEGNLELFEKLCGHLKRFPKGLEAITDEAGMNLLHYSLQAGKSEIAKFLIKNQMKIESTDIYQRNAMTFALYGRDVSCLQLCSKEQAYDRDYFGVRPIDIAVNRYKRGLTTELEIIVSDTSDFSELTQSDMQPPINIYQMHLIDKLKKYLEVTQRQESELYSKLLTIDGLCEGFSFNAALDFVRNPQKTNIKEQSNFFSTLKMLSVWDEEESSLSIKSFDSNGLTQGELIEQLLNDVIFFHAQSFDVTQQSKKDRQSRHSIAREIGSEETVTKLADITLNNMQETEFNEILLTVLKPNIILDISTGNHNINISMNDADMIQFYDPNMPHEISLFASDEINNLTKFVYDFLSKNHTIPESDSWNYAEYIPRYIGIYQYENPKLQLTQTGSTIDAEDLVERFIIQNMSRAANVDESIMICTQHDSDCSLRELITKYQPDVNKLSFYLAGAITNNSLNCVKAIFESPYLTQDDLVKLGDRADFSKNPSLYQAWQSALVKSSETKYSSPSL